MFDRYANRFRVFQLVATRYQELHLTDDRYWFEEIQLGLGVWQGAYRETEGLWLRWYGSDGRWLPLPNEQVQQERDRAEAAQQQAEVERQRANEEQQRAEVAQQQAEVERQRAEAAQQQAEAERQRANEEQQRSQQLAERLRALGVDPDQL